MRQPSPHVWAQTLEGDVLHMVKAEAFGDGRVATTRSLCSPAVKTYYLPCSAGAVGVPQCGLCQRKKLLTRKLIGGS